MQLQPALLITITVHAGHFMALFALAHCSNEASMSALSAFHCWYCAHVESSCHGTLQAWQNSLLQ